MEIAIGICAIAGLVCIITIILILMILIGDYIHEHRYSFLRCFFNIRAWKCIVKKHDWDLADLQRHGSTGVICAHCDMEIVRFLCKKCNRFSAMVANKSKTYKCKSCKKKIVLWREFESTYGISAKRALELLVYYEESDVLIGWSDGDGFYTEFMNFGYSDGYNHNLADLFLEVLQKQARKNY